MFNLTVESPEKPVVQCNCWHAGAGIEGQARRATHRRRDSRREMAELKGRQQQETERKLPFHSRLTLRDWNARSHL